MENEENRGPINKNYYEDQFTNFCQFSVGALSLFSLSYTLGHLDFSWSTLGGCGILGVLEQGHKGRVGKRERTLGSTTTIGFPYRY